ncbi:hypothetical protein [Arthrobacter sp. ISL-28]|uniref:hypothetical protein n=1 Tax=Arthrobacter sp. ISL-28 TaxID=2819108 RepID=UPI001BE72931|nr:hypothetical protein [Arthrobacter sp. ISL-28]MBT2523269.1 hypothetical protein [Arthrobacter sp. ISL-28]
MTLSHAQTADLLSPKRADTLAGADVIGSKVVANVAAAILVDRGYRESFATGAQRVYQLTPDGAPVRVRWADLQAVVADLVDELLVELLSGAPADGDGAKRATALRKALKGQDKAPTGYRRAVARDARDRLTAMTDDELDAAEDAQRAAAREARASRPSLAPEAVTVQKATSAKRQATREEDLAATADLLSKWAPGLPAGRHLLGDVWTSWDHTIQASEKLRAADHGARRIGRSRFYELLARDFSVVNGGARQRYLVVA